MSTFPGFCGSGVATSDPVAHAPGSLGAAQAAAFAGSLQPPCRTAIGQHSAPCVDNALLA